MYRVISNCSFPRDVWHARCQLQHATDITMEGCHQRQLLAMEGRHQRELLAMGLPWKAANMEGCSRAQLLAVSVLASGLAAFLAVLHSLRTSPRPGAAFSPMPSGHAIDSYRGTSMAAPSSMTARAAMMTVAPSCGIDDAIAFLFAMQASPSPSPSPTPITLTYRLPVCHAEARVVA